MNQDTEADGLAKLENLAFHLASLDVPVWFKNPDYSFLFKDQSTYDDLATLAPLTLAPKLGAVLLSDKAPSVDFFRSLPSPEGKKLWGAYAVLMCHALYGYKLYIGSGSEQKRGVQPRMSVYSPDHSGLPHLVSLALKKGYTIQHVGLLCSTPIPSDSLVPKVRSRILLFEALLGFIFHAGFAASTDLWVKDCILWPRASVTWDPLCTHSSLIEAIRGGLSLSPEELEMAAAKRRQNTLQREKGYRAKEREKNPEAFKEKERQKSKNRRANFPEKVKEVNQKQFKKNREAKRFFCDICQHVFGAFADLQKHKNTKSHRDHASGITKAGPTPAALARNRKFAQDKAAKKYYCQVCDTAVVSQQVLDKHCNSEAHKRRVKEQAEG
jgi:hypothetical protein